MSNAAVKNNKMAVMPVNKLMLNMGFPMIISMMLQAVYNIVDSAFIANMKEHGEFALNALTLAFPVQMLMIAVGIGTGVGVNALLAKSMGQGDLEKAGKTAGNGVFLMAVIYVVFLLFGIFGTSGYIATQTQNPIIADMAVDYLRICCCLSFGSLYFALYEKVLQATGKSLYSTISQILGAVINIILDPIMIYGLFGCPEMGVSGAAYATVIGQIASAVCGWALHVKANKEIKNSFSYMKPSAKIIKGIYSVGFAAIVAQALMSAMTYFLNVILVRIGENVVTAYGLYYKIQQFILFAAFGLRDAITPIVSFNHGMKNQERVKDGIKYGMLYTLIIMLIGFAGIECFADPFAGIFGLSGETKQLCVSAMRVISISYVFAGANIAFQGIFQALDCGLESLIISVCRQFLFVIPAAYVFSNIVLSGICGIWLVWISFLLAEVLSALAALYFMKKVNRTKILVMNESVLCYTEKNQGRSGCMKLKNILIVVNDIEASRNFYHDLFGLDMILNQEGNMILTEGLVLQDAKIWKMFTGKDVIPENHAFELYFETQDIEAFAEKLETLYPKINYVSRLPHRIQFYDLDGTLIEVGCR